nr:transcription factor GTE12-like [Ipomoea batatas]
MPEARDRLSRPVDIAEVSHTRRKRLREGEPGTPLLRDPTVATPSAILNEVKDQNAQDYWEFQKLLQRTPSAKKAEREKRVSIIAAVFNRIPLSLSSFAAMTLANLKIRVSTGKRDDREKGLKMMRNENKNLESKKCTLANLKIRVSTGKRDDREKGLKMMRNDNKNLESKKRGSDDDFKVDDRKEKRRRIMRMDYYSIREDCEKKEKESCSRSDHCSSRATIDEGCTTSQLSPTKALRAAQMKKRYAHLIFKATHQPLGDPLKQQQERERLEIAEKARIEEEIKAAQTLLRMRAEADLKIQREAARTALEKMEKTVEFNDAWQIMRDFESLLNSTGC